MASKAKRLCGQCASGDCNERALTDGSVGPITGLPLCEEHHTAEAKRVKQLQQRTADKLRELRSLINPEQLRAEQQSLAAEIQAVEAAFAEAQATLLEWKARYVAGVAAAAAARMAVAEAADEADAEAEDEDADGEADAVEAAAVRLRSLESAIDEHMAGVMERIPGEPAARP